MKILGKLIPWYRAVQWTIRIYKIIKLFTMADKGYLSNKREQRLARILDGLFDFRSKLKKKKILFGLLN